MPEKPMLCECRWPGVAVTAGYALVQVGCERSSHVLPIAGLRCIDVRQSIAAGWTGSSLGQDHEMSCVSGDP